MNKTEQKLAQAFNARRPCTAANSAVVVQGDGSALAYLHGNHIATHHADGTKEVNIPTLTQWPTATTRSRLRALGFDVYQKARVTYLGDVAVA